LRSSLARAWPRYQTSLSRVWSFIKQLSHACGRIYQTPLSRVPSHYQTTLSRATPTARAYTGSSEKSEAGGAGTDRHSSAIIEFDTRTWGAGCGARVRARNQIELDVVDVWFILVLPALSTVWVQMWGGGGWGGGRAMRLSKTRCARRRGGLPPSARTLPLAVNGTRALTTTTSDMQMRKENQQHVRV
jgi:hypothetical protein